MYQRVVAHWNNPDYHGQRSRWQPLSVRILNIIWIYHTARAKADSTLRVYVRNKCAYVGGCVCVWRYITQPVPVNRRSTKIYHHTCTLYTHVHEHRSHYATNTAQSPL